MEKSHAKSEYTPLALRVTSLRFDGAGSGTRESFSYAALYEEQAEECTLSYREATEREGADAAMEPHAEEGSLVRISYKKATPCVVKLAKEGATATEMTFAAGARFAAQYAVRGLGSFAAAGETRRVSNTLTREGGELLLDYTLTLGGVRSRTVLTLRAACAARDPACTADNAPHKNGGEEAAPCR